MAPWSSFYDIIVMWGTETVFHAHQVFSSFRYLDYTVRVTVTFMAVTVTPTLVAVPMFFVSVTTSTVTVLMPTSVAMRVSVKQKHSQDINYKTK